MDHRVNLVCRCFLIQSLGRLCHALYSTPDPCQNCGLGLNILVCLLAATNKVNLKLGFQSLPPCLEVSLGARYPRLLIHRKRRCISRCAARPRYQVKPQGFHEFKFQVPVTFSGLTPDSNPSPASLAAGKKVSRRLHKLLGYPHNSDD